MAKDFFEHVKKRYPREVLEKAEKRYRQLKKQMLLRELREALNVSQSDLSSATGIRQPNLSKLERQNDMQVATLRRVVEALGGKVEIIAHFPNANVKIMLPHAA